MNYGGYGYGYGYDDYGRGSRSTTINAELQSQLEIKIKARISSSQKLEFTFKPSMLVYSGSLASSSASSSYGYGSGRSGSRGGSRNTIYLPITHLVHKVFPKYIKQYKSALPANSSLIFIDEVEYQRYINYANGLIYPDDEVVPKSDSQFKRVYVIDDDVEMINQNIAFIVNKLFNENRIISNITGRPELGSRLGSGYGTGSQPDRVNQEYYIETFFIPSPTQSQNNKQIYTDASEKIAEYLKTEKDLLAKIDDDKQKLKQQQSLQPQDRTKLAIVIARNEMKRQKLISQRVAYEYGQINSNLQQLKSKEKKLKTDIAETKRIIDDTTQYHDRAYPHHHDKTYYTQRMTQYTRELTETKSILESMKLRMCIITITDMILIPKILNNGKENPQFTILYNQFMSRDRTLGADAGRNTVGNNSCSADKRAIEVLYNQIVSNTVKEFRHSDISAPIGSEAISRATTNPSSDESMIEKMETVWTDMGKDNSAEYFEINPLGRAPSEDVFRATLERDETGNNAEAMALIRTRMGAYPVFFTLFGTPKLYRPDDSDSTKTTTDIVNVVREPHRSKQDGGTKMKIQGLSLILNSNMVPPHFFTLKCNPVEYNKFKTVEIPYANVKIMDFTGTVYTPPATVSDAAAGSSTAPDAAGSSTAPAPTDSDDASAPASVPVSAPTDAAVDAAKSIHDDIEQYVKSESTGLTTELEDSKTTVVAVLSHEDEPLPMKGEKPTEYQRMQSSGNENDCLVHSLLTALSSTFRTLDVNGKNEIASKFRRKTLVALYDKLINTKNNQREKAEPILMKRDLAGSSPLDSVIAGQFGLEYHIGIFIRDRNNTKWIFMGDDRASSFIILYNSEGRHYEAVRKSTNQYIFNMKIIKIWLARAKIENNVIVTECAYNANDKLYISESAFNPEWIVDQRNFGDDIAGFVKKCTSLNVKKISNDTEKFKNVPIHFFRLKDGKKIFDVDRYNTANTAFVSAFAPAVAADAAAAAAAAASAASAASATGSSVINSDTHVSQIDTDKMLIEWIKYNAEFIKERTTQRTNFIKQNIVDIDNDGLSENDITGIYNTLFTTSGFYDFITADDIPSIITYADFVIKNQHTLRIFKDIFTVKNYNYRKKNRDDGMGEIRLNNFGLRNNKSSFCFLHSIIQLLFDIPELITKLSGTEYDKLPMSLSEEHKPNIIIRMLSKIIKYINGSLGKRLFLGDVKFTLSGNEFHAVAILMKLLSKDGIGSEQDAGEFLVLILNLFKSQTITSDNIVPEVKNADDVSRITSDLVQTAVGNSNSDYVALSVQPINITNLINIGLYILIGVIRTGVGHFAYMHINNTNDTKVSVNHFDDSQIIYDEDKKITDFKVSALLYKKEGNAFSLFDGGGGGGGGRHSRRMRKIKKTRSTRRHVPTHS